MKKLFLFFLFQFLCFLVYCQNPILCGLNFNGGAGSVPSYGNIFSFNTASNSYNSLYNFTNSFEASSPRYTHLIETTNGKLLGMAELGGNFNRGSIFEYNYQSNSFTKRFDFDSINGSYPTGSLFEANNGKIYGMTSRGGLYNYGVLFEFDNFNNTFITKINFDSISNGMLPYGTLIQAANGKLYGYSSKGGLNNLGILFEYDINTNTLQKKIDFIGFNGANPNASLIASSNGKLYGLTPYGGTSNLGVLFEFDTQTNSLTVLFDFATPGTNASHPFGSPIEASNGKLYGLANNFNSCIFEFDLSTNTFIKKHDFIAISDGNLPYGDLIQVSNDKLYGFTKQDGSNGGGTLFEYDFILNNFSVRYNFSSSNSFLYGSPYYASNGKIYGLSYKGGYSDCGTLFEYDFGLNSISTKVELCAHAYNKQPSGNLLQISNNKFYGVCTNGGIQPNSAGSIFEFDKSINSVSIKYGFGGIDGSIPSAGLISASNGKLYGMTQGGGNFNWGVLYEYDITNNPSFFTKKIDFNSLATGGTPKGRLLEATNQKLYGLTSVGGINNDGALFEYSINTNSILKVADFNDLTNGKNPFGNLIQAANGKLYGMTQFGGIYGAGCLFEYDILSNSLTNKYNFGGNFSNGSNPIGSLYEASNGKLYGMTCYGGINGEGVLFAYDLTIDSLQNLYNFAFSTGINVSGNLMEASNGNLYGMSQSGGLYNYGVIFEFNIANSSYNKLYDLDLLTSGGNPDFPSLIECATGTTSIHSYLKEKDFTIVSPNPARDELILKCTRNQKESVILKFFDSLGNLIFKENLNLQKGSNSHSVSIRKFSPGLYFISLESQMNSRQTIRVSISK